MSRWLALSKSKHLTAGWQSFGNYSFTAKDATSPLLEAEIGHALRYYPIGFIWSNDKYELVIMLSLHQGVNLYVNTLGDWLAPYVPSYFRSYPFRLQRNINGDHILCVDEESTLFNSTALAGDQRLFDDNGSYTEKFGAIVEFMQLRQRSLRQTQALVEQLSNLKLITPWLLTRTSSSDKSIAVRGLFRIDELALKTLPGAELSSLAQSGALALAYAQIFSLSRIEDLEHRYRLREQEQAREASGMINLDDLFGNQGEGLKF